MRTDVRFRRRWLRRIIPANSGTKLKSPPRLIRADVRCQRDALNIAPRIQDARFLDLCAGSGLLVSKHPRGARNVCRSPAQAVPTHQGNLDCAVSRRGRPFAASDAAFSQTAASQGSNPGTSFTTIRHVTTMLRCCSFLLITRVVVSERLADRRTRSPQATSG